MSRSKTKGKGSMYESKLYKILLFFHNDIQIVRYDTNKKIERLAQLHTNKRVLEKKLIFLDEKSSYWYQCLSNLQRNHKGEREEDKQHPSNIPMIVRM